METGGGGVLRELVCNAWRLLWVIHLISFASARAEGLADGGHRALGGNKRAAESDLKT